MTCVQAGKSEGVNLPTTLIDGIKTRYEVIGSGPPLLMYSPAGFDATLDKWTTQGVYARIKLLDHLPKKYTCIIFDRRETGQSGGRVERITWAHYVAQGKGLLDHLNFKRAHLMGGCMGCCSVIAFGVAYPDAVLSMEPRGGPWASVIRNDRAFADSYAKEDVGKYKQLVTGMCRTLFDRDTSPGAEPEDMLRLDIPALVIPGRDASHATSAARYLEECLPRAEYWDVLPDGQTEETAPARLLEFLDKATAGAR